MYQYTLGQQNPRQQQDSVLCVIASYFNLVRHFIGHALSLSRGHFALGFDAANMLQMSYDLIQSKPEH